MYAHHRVCWAQSPAQPGTFDLPTPRVHEAEAGRSNPDARKAGPLSVLLFIGGQRA